MFKNALGMLAGVAILSVFITIAISEFNNRILKERVSGGEQRYKLLSAFCGISLLYQFVLHPELSHLFTLVAGIVLGWISCECAHKQNIVMTLRGMWHLTRTYWIAVATFSIIAISGLWHFAFAP